MGVEVMGAAEEVEGWRSEGESALVFHSVTTSKAVPMGLSCAWWDSYGVGISSGAPWTTSTVDGPWRRCRRSSTATGGDGHTGSWSSLRVVLNGFEFFCATF